MVSIIGTGIVLGLVIVPGQQESRRDSAGSRREIGDLRESMARLEGLFEGFMNRQKDKG